LKVTAVIAPVAVTAETVAVALAPPPLLKERISPTAYPAPVPVVGAVMLATPNLRFGTAVACVPPVPGAGRVTVAPAA
jgi:alkanesulfonate monooxygenase SsuD/methylene tetrahydromethanopterin reductase-like flavin-dependent oxidoreductase (luciferase family)